MPDQFVQTSTESKKQIKKAGKQERAIDHQDKMDLLGLLDDVRFRRFVWRLLEETRMFETIWEPNGSAFNFQAGRQDIGHWLWVILEQARPEAMLSIIQERQRRKESE